MSVCKTCKRDLTHDEVALYKRMVSRGAEEFLCIDCMADYYGVTKQGLEKKIVEFKEMGCLLFEQRQ